MSRRKKILQLFSFDGMSGRLLNNLSELHHEMYDIEFLVEGKSRLIEGVHRVEIPKQFKHIQKYYHPSYIIFLFERYILSSQPFTIKEATH